MNEPQKAYSRRQLISVAEVANALALSRDIAGLEAIQQLAEFAHQGKLCADLYPPHQYWQHGGQSDLIGKPADNSVQVWRSLSSKSVERHMSDKDDFNYPPAASTYHLLADDVFAFAQNGCLSPRAAKAMLDLAVRHKAELVSDQASEPRPIAAPAPPIESQQQAPALAEPPPAQPQAAAPAPEVAESAGSVPSNGLATAQIGVIFDGLPYTAENWPKRASDINWLEPARVALGAAGGATSLWCPATLARLIHGRGRGAARQKTLEALNRKFKSNPVLQPWLAAWNEYYDMFNDAD